MPAYRHARRKANYLPFTIAVCAVVAVIIITVIVIVATSGDEPTHSPNTTTTATASTHPADTTAESTTISTTAASTTTGSATGNRTSGSGSAGNSGSGSGAGSVSGSSDNMLYTGSLLTVPVSGSVTKTQKEVKYGLQILVNNEYDYDENQPTDHVMMTAFSGRAYKIAYNNLDADRFTLKEFNRMTADFKNIYPNEYLQVCSGYRTIATQKRNFDNSVAENGLEETLKWFTRPGYSEHHTGFSIDFNTNAYGSAAFTGKGNQAWFSKNCHKYGFILRYQADKYDITRVNAEPWHFRQVGIPHADYIMKNNLCLEEYIDKIKNYSHNDPLTITPDAGGTYNVYYVKSTGASTVIDLSGYKSYYCSGNNVDGFIITAQK